MVRLDAQAKTQLLQEARADGRTISGMVARIVAEWLKTRVSPNG